MGSSSSQRHARNVGLRLRHRPSGLPNIVTDLPHSDEADDWFQTPTTMSSPTPAASNSESWRQQLKRDDAVDVFVAGQWQRGEVTECDSECLVVQFSPATDDFYYFGSVEHLTRKDRHLRLPKSAGSESSAEPACMAQPPSHWRETLRNGDDVEILIDHQWQPGKVDRCGEDI